MAFVRAALLMVLGVVGGYLGNHLGSLYVHLDVIRRIIGENPQLDTLSQYGFTAIGVLAGVYGYSRAIAAKGTSPSP